jgi:hypothetical protein
MCTAASWTYSCTSSEGFREGDDRSSQHVSETDMYRAAMDEIADATLVPSPESVIALIELVTALGWPDKDADQGSYFRQLGFYQGEGREGFQQGYGYSAGPDSLERLGGELVSTGLPVLHASWASYRGELYSINFFLYEGINGQDKSAVLGYRSLFSRLRSVYGPPADFTTRAFDEATSLWEVNGTSIEMYCFTQPTPVLQLGFSHKSRNAASKASMTNLNLPLSDARGSE